METKPIQLNLSLEVSQGGGVTARSVAYHGKLKKILILHHGRLKKPNRFEHWSLWHVFLKIKESIKVIRLKQ